MDRKKNFTSMKCFDLQYEGKTYHGNYQPARNIDATINYCRKHDNYIEEMPEDESDIDIFEKAVKSTQEEFIKHCIKYKISQGYCNQIWEMTRSLTTINEDSAGQNANNQESCVTTSNDSDTMPIRPLFTMTKMKRTLSPVHENQYSSLEKQGQEKQLGQLRTCPNPFSLYPTWTGLKDFKQEDIDQSYLTTCRSNTYQEMDKYTSLTETNLDRYMSGMEPSKYLQVW